MRIVPSLPPPIKVAKEGVEAKALTRVKAAKPVQARTLPPLIVKRPARPEATDEYGERPEQRHDAHVNGERRTYCRRIEHLPVLLELRSGTDRRRHQQRAGDLTEHVDDEA